MLRIYSGTEEWSALYEDGQLVTAGDHHIVLQEALDRAGVLFDTEDDDAFMLGGGQYADVAKTEAVIDAYREMVISRREQAAELRRKAQLLLDEAEEMERRG